MTEPDVATLLAQSMALHREAFAARHAKRNEMGLLLLEQARRLRLDADALDPSHAARAWSDEQQHTPVGRNTHTALLAFYEQQLGR